VTIPSSTQNAINSAVSGNNGASVSVNMGNSTSLPQTTIDAIAGKDVNLTLNFGDSQIVINGKDVPEGFSGALSLGISQSESTTRMSGSAIPNSALRQQAQNLPVQQLRIGAAGSSVAVSGSATVKIGEQYEGQNAILASYNAETGKFEFVSGGTIGENGNATVNFNKTGDFIVIVKQTGDITGTGVVDKTDAVEILKHLLGISELSPIQQFAANGGKGNVSETDALNILKLVLGLIDKI
jgi:hypothetical protein